ncbi:MAG: hypothetical protein A3H45_08145 [Ignavibacteria bacterium RIFCSPLOWO2_02_FULL_55_14]|nr:MAG: hypothetical protein A3G43_12745 [Ignavibacteria bacterium RIFCSPLOWO2_12_FULL_56_21]OGU72295.1 MAG: hypothetical protein A3H45_08145 [Ignavibacteria bacterium RIFCSPLOWO2_02_FULL_55_14]
MLAGFMTGPALASPRIFAVFESIPTFLQTVSTPSRWVLAVCLLVLIAGALSLNDALLYTPDSARYLVWAKSLSTFNGFLDDTSPEPVRYVVHAPLYPLLLAPVAWIWPWGVEGAKAWTLLMALGALWLFYRWTAEAAGEVVAAAATGLLGVHSLFLLYATQVLSEIPFAVAFMAALIKASQLEAQKKRPNIADHAGLVLSLGAAMFLREVGVAVIAGMLLYWLFQKRWRSVLIVGGLCILLYVLWFVRNEVIVAGIEQPPLRNSQLLVTHLYTPKDASLLAEFAARIVNNGRVYAGHLSTIVFAPDFIRQSHGLVSPGHPLAAAAGSLTPFAAPLFLILSFGSALTGIILTWRTQSATRLTTVVMAAYFGPILIYPINDVRFLFPLVLFLLHFGAVGFRTVVDRWPELSHRQAVRWTAVGLAIVCLFPNVAWASSFVANNWRFAHDPNLLKPARESEAELPDYYYKRLSAPGRWISAHADKNAIVLSRWKEIALWLEGRDVLDVDPQMTPDSFDRTLRDYRVQYLASVRWRVGLRENETQIEYSSRYDFVPQMESGSVEVLKVVPKKEERIVKADISADADSPTMFRTALRLLRRGEPTEAESLLVRVEQRMGRYGALVYHTAVAKALAGRYDEALAVFEKFQSIPQAGSFLQQAWYHQEIISRIRGAQAAAFPEDRATKFHIIAVNYWELGYRASCFRMIDSSLAVQPSFFPALMFASIFHYQDGDVASSAAYWERARRVNATNLLVEHMKAVLEADRDLRKARDDAERIRQHQHKAVAFLAMDMREDAIDEFLAILDIQPAHRQALRNLVGIYTDKRRYGPAREYAQRLVEASPNDRGARELLKDLEVRWE